MSLSEANERFAKWQSLTDDQKADAKALRTEKTFWSDQLRKAHNTKGITYKRFDGSKGGIVGKQYSVEDKANHLITWLESISTT